MGNCCGSEAAYDDSTPAHTRPQKPRVTGAGHTLGGSVDSGSGVNPRAAAALAAEQRNMDAGKGGKLATQLAADKAKTQQQHLKDASSQNRQSQQESLQWD